MSSTVFIRSLDERYGWGLSVEAFTEYVAFLDRCLLKDLAERETAVCGYHSDRALVSVLGNPSHPQYDEAVGYVRMRSLQIIGKHGALWNKDAALSDEDLCQEGMAKMFSNLHKFKYESAFLSWLTAILINEARQANRKQSTRSRKGIKVPLEDYLEAIVFQESVESSAIHNMTIKDFEEILENSKDSRLLIIFQMYHHHDATLEMIGGRLDLSVSRVYSLLEIVRKLLKSYLDQQ
ncbi:sigma-70 family RNA polymerase sigma factor [Herpetosiphon llansteffanensis]|uniref:sigma-70 family RNA polymerase sigma factor n=1 Tax=Herpetosiphon llansteffanensis TaxID=2094568 RepID=UPI000D7CE954|nr:sigma-70 family RNA polymerase sigma factor [Herpetosiphon llansteffanensis]